MHPRSTLLLIGLAVTAGLLAGAAPAGAIPWPYTPFDQTHGLGNHYGEFQNYGGSPYYHDGIDLVTPSGPVAVYSVAAGTLTHLTFNDPYYSGLMIGEPVVNGRGWLYWHITSSTMPFDIGDPVGVNDYIGTTAFWPVSNFHHVHFNEVQGTGGYPWSWYTSIGNPLEFLEPHTDSAPPVFEITYQGKRFAFAAQGTGTVLNSDALSGNVDIISRISDVVGMPQWLLNPWKIEYWIDGATQSVPLTLSVNFTGLCPTDNTVSTIYRTQSPMITQGDYDSREFYFIVTNTDGDGYVETTDGNAYWNTATAGPGDYWVYVRAQDIGGNAVTDSMRCTVAGAVNPDIFLPETSHDFGPVAPGGSETWPMVVRNAGSDPLSIRTLTINSPRFTADRAHFFVAPGAEEVVNVTFQPLQQQVYAATLELATNDPNEGIVQVALYGEGADPSAVPPAEAEPATLRILSLRALPGAGVGVRFELPRAAAVTAAVHDVTGRRLHAAHLGIRAAGVQDWGWNGRDAAGAALPSGVYFVRLSADGRETRGAGLLMR
jgi:hypothetical protein